MKTDKSRVHVLSLWFEEPESVTPRSATAAQSVTFAHDPRFKPRVNRRSAAERRARIDLVPDVKDVDDQDAALDLLIKLGDLLLAHLKARGVK
jgi:hypothetical protein